jgi:hypothetical protein
MLIMHYSKNYLDLSVIELKKKLYSEKAKLRHIESEIENIKDLRRMGYHDIETAHEMKNAEKTLTFTFFGKGKNSELESDLKLLSKC